jgi:nucleoside-diphosphate-sugar epimerase
VNLTVFGSTGRTGRHVVEQAMARGHRVTAFTRRPAALDCAGLAAVVHGDGRDPQAVRTAVRGADAVIAVIGPASRTGPHQVAEVAGTLVAAMTDDGVRRLVVTSAYPLVGDRPRVPMALLRKILAAVYADAAAMERAVAGSGLDWTIARLNRLTGNPATGQPRISPGLFARPTAITRADAARALLDITEDQALARTAVNIAGPARKGTP